MRKHSKLIRLAVLLLALVQVAAFFPRGGILPVSAAPDSTQGQTSKSVDKTADYMMRAREYFNSKLYSLKEDEGDPEEVIRVMVELEGDTAAATAVVLNYNDEAKAAEAAALRNASSIVAQVEKLTGNKVINQTAYLFKGFSIEAKRSQMSEIAAIKGVKSVYPVTEFKQDMITAVDVTTATELWAKENGGYTGEGIAIAVVDSGTNYLHPDMKLDDGAKVKFTKEEMEAKIAELGRGTYYTEKVPFGYSYGGKMDNDVLNENNVHGLHVSGIAAANGSIKGVAPNAQILAMQVFTDSGTAYTDDIIRAVEDAVKLGADIVNFSLGGGAGFYNDIDYLQRALEYAEENGVVCCVAAGNDGSATSVIGEDTNEWGIADNGTVSSPSTYPGALSVASIDNAFTLTPVIDIYREDGKTAVVENYPAWDFSQGTVTNWTGIGKAALIDCGYGDVAEFKNLPADGKWIALISRGGNDSNGTAITFEAKIKNAVAKGASGVIIYNNEATDEIVGNLGAGDDPLTVPAIHVSGNLGRKLQTIAKAGESIVVKGFETRAIYTGLNMSTFSSWGPTETLDIKPEITAVGGNVRSTVNGTGYDYMSGTSMATPYMSGAAAIVLQALKDAQAKGELNLKDIGINKFLKATVMNTAVTLMNGDNIYPVRQQGAGLVDPLAAANNRVIATSDGLAAITLKEVSKGKTEFTVTLTNYGTKDVTYSLPGYTQVYTDYTETDAQPGFQYTYDVVMKDTVITFSDTSVTVPAGGTAEFTGTLSIGNEALKDHFVEAFVTLKGDIDLSLPLLGYYGDWDDAGRIVDLPAYEDGSILPNVYEQFVGVLVGNQLATWLISDSSQGGTFLGLFGADALSNLSTFDPTYFAFSPNGDGEFDHVVPCYGLLRSAGEMTVNVLDANKNLLTTLEKFTEQSKNVGYDIATSQAPYMILTMPGEPGSWDGTLYNQKTGEYELAPEGQYYISIRASLPESDKVEETIIPITLDVTAPEIKILDVSNFADDGILSVEFTLKDSSPLIDDVIIYVNGHSAEIVPSEFYNEKTGTYIVPLSNTYYDVNERNEIAVVTMDVASNESLEFYYANAKPTSSVEFTNIDLTDDPLILTDLSYTRTQVGTRDYEITDIVANLRGYVARVVEKLTVNGVEADIEDNGNFTVEVPVELGYNTLTVKTFDREGKEVSNFEKEVLVDLSAPAISGWVTDADHSGEWDEDNILYSVDNGLFGPEFGTKYKENDKVPVRFQFEDESLTKVNIKWIEGDITTTEMNNINMAFFMYPMFGMVGAPVTGPGADKVKELNYTAGEIKDGVLDLSFPFFIERAKDWGIYGNSFDIAQQWIAVTAYDAAGNINYYILSITGGEFALEEYDYYGDADMREDNNMINQEDINFTDLAPIWDGEGPMPESVVITPDMVDEDGVLHLTGTFPEYMAEFRYEGKLWIDPTWKENLIANGYTVPDDATVIPENRKISFDIKLQPGANVLYYTASHPQIDMTWRVMLYYIPEGMETLMTFNNTAIEDGAVIYTKDEQFLVDGSVFTSVGFVQLYVNGNHVVAYSKNGVDVTGEGRTVGFSHSVKLEEGENIITVEMYDATMEIQTVEFTVVLDKTAPNAPVITAKDGTVTITSDEEGTTIYYSFDGETWVPYTDEFTLEDTTTVYAKAVDAAGNESETVSLKVAVAPNAPAITADDKGNVTITTDEENVKLYYSLDGKTWKEYTGTVALDTSATVYAKAVDADGLESEVAELAVSVPSNPSTPPETQNPPTTGGDTPKPPKTGDEGYAFCMIMLAISAIGIIFLAVEKKRAANRK